MIFFPPKKFLSANVYCKNRDVEVKLVCNQGIAAEETEAVAQGNNENPLHSVRGAEHEES